jgi:hypothetical protein
VLAYAIHGNVARVSKTINIPVSTLRDWQRSDWWDSLTIEVRTEKDVEIIAGLDRIVGLAITETQDRLENGDAVFHQGELKRVPVKGKDAAVIGAVAIDKRQILLNKPTSIRGTASEGMAALAKQFEELARASQTKVVSEQ